MRVLAELFFSFALIVTITFLLFKPLSPCFAPSKAALSSSKFKPLSLRVYLSACTMEELRILHWQMGV